MNPKYETNLKTFIGNLPSSSIRYLHFKEVLNPNPTAPNNAFILYPVISATAKLWSDSRLPNNKPLYIIYANNAYCHLFKDNGIKYDVFLNQYGEVDSFERQELPYTDLQGGMEQVEARWGNHYTVGVERSAVTGNMMLMTHITEYLPSKTNSLLYTRAATYCNMLLTDYVKHKHACLNEKGRPVGSLEYYETNENDYDIIPILQILHKKIMGGQTAGNSSVFTTYHGKSHKVHIGPKGGAHIICNGGSNRR